MSRTVLPVLLLALIQVQSARPGASNASPTFSNEHLRYNINWPSGLSLGESQLSASRSKTASGAPGPLEMDFNVDAAIPGFEVSDRFHSSASADFCSVEFDKKTSHGKKKSDEKTTFDAANQTATRQTEGGGKSELKTPSCGKDALAFLYFVRRELSQGRLPPSQPVFFGSIYQVRVEYVGTQSIKLGDKPVEADRLNVSLKGPSSDISFEAYFLKDGARTPALVKVPLALGTFSMELVREQ